MEASFVIASHIYANCSDAKRKNPDRFKGEEMDDKLRDTLLDLKEEIDHPPYPLRNPCGKCGETRGRIQPTGLQDVVRCLNGHFQYNAPRTETGKQPRTLQTIRHTPPSQRYRLFERAHGRCELCGSTEMLTIDHFLSVAEGFDFLTDAQIESDENKCVLCAECNSGKAHHVAPIWLLAAVLYRRTKE